MGLFDSISNSINQKSKEVHLKRRKRRQNIKQQQAKKRGDIKTVARYSKAKKKSNKARGKAQKSFVKSTVKSGVGLAKVGVSLAQGDVIGAGMEFI